MKLLYRIISFFAAFTLLSGTCVYAAKSDLEKYLNGPDLDTIINEFVEEHGLNENNFACAYYNTETGETFLWNGDTYFLGASLYKLPLNMYYTEEIANGNADPEKLIYGMSYDDICRQSIEFSSNDISYMLRNYLGGFRASRSLYTKYFTDKPDELPQMYFADNYFSAEQYIHILKYLYENSDIFSDIIGFMKAAQPGQYFKRNIDLSEKYEIAQKYGYLDEGNLNTGGIVYTEHPFLLTAMTYKAPSAEQAVADLAVVFADYTNRVTEKLREEADAALPEQVEITPAPSTVPSPESSALQIIVETPEPSVLPDKSIDDISNNFVPDNSSELIAYIIPAAAVLLICTVILAAIIKKR